jgi:hypothetical protein
MRKLQIAFLVLAFYPLILSLGAAAEQRTAGLTAFAGALFCRTTGQATLRDMNFSQSREDFPVNLGSQQSFLGLVYYF